ncbi:hypothetical protein HDV01_000927 [Terramyces sp. JEL0728]|nr:hypothetical protein HDV01_000927 [Terramyces sp. JEL0728]
MIFVYLVYPGLKLVEYLRKEQRNDKLLAPSLLVCSMQIAISARLYLLLGDSFTLRITILLDLIALLCGGLALSNFVSYFVGATTGTNLSELWQVNGQQINPVLGLKLIRVLVFVYNIIVYILWEIYGLQSPEAFNIYRRYAYYFSAILSLLTAWIYWVLIAKIVNVLTKKVQRRNMGEPISLYFIRMVKAFIIVAYAVPSTLQNFFRVIGNEYYLDSLVYWQVATEGLYLITTSCWAVYILYKAFPNVLKHKSTSAKVAV